MFSKAEAVDFAEKTLKIENPLVKFRENPLDLLNCLVRAFHNAIPSQSATLLAVDVEERRVPSVGDIRQALLSGMGGLCIVNNSSLKFLVEALGFNVKLVPSTVTFHNHHCVVIVSNVLRDGDQFLLEAGCCYPTFEAIPLDFDAESPVYRHSFLQFRLVRKGELIERQHFKRSHDSIGEDIRKWVRFYDFNPNSIAVDVSYFDPYMEVEYTGTSGSVFAFCLRVVSFKNDKCTALKDNSLLVEGDDHRLHETKLKSTDEMKHHLREMCPNIPSHVIAKALAFWEKKIKPRLELDQGGLSAVDIEEIV